MNIDPRILKVADDYAIPARKFGLADKDDVQLMEDIAAFGVSFPLSVRKEGDTYYIVDGLRRHAACLELYRTGRSENVRTVPINVLDPLPLMVDLDWK